MTSITADSWVTLKDGSEIPKDAFFRFRNNIERLAKDHFRIFEELVLNCRNSNYPLISDEHPIAILKQYDLINRHDLVYEIAKLVVLNSAEGNIPSIRLVDSLKV